MRLHDLAVGALGLEAPSGSWVGVCPVTEPADLIAHVYLEYTKTHVVHRWECELCRTC